MSDAYAAAGVDLGQSDAAVAAIVARLGRIELGRPSRSVLRGGHYASVLRITDELGVALTHRRRRLQARRRRAGRSPRDGRHRLRRDERQRPRLRRRRADRDARLPRRRGVRSRAARAHRRGAARRRAGGRHRDPRRRARGAPRADPRPSRRPRGFDLCGAAFGTVALDAMVTGEAIAVGDALVGVPSTGLHSNGYTLARRALLSDGGLGLDDRPPELGGASVADALLEPTAIYVRAVLELLALRRAGARPRAHHRRRPRQPASACTTASPTGSRRRSPVPPIFGLVQRLGNVPDEEMWRGVQHGLRVHRASCPADAADEAAARAGRAPCGRAAHRHRDRRAGRSRARATLTSARSPSPHRRRRCGRGG